jgi:hypothetical protein
VLNSRKVVLGNVSLTSPQDGKYVPVGTTGASRTWDVSNTTLVENASMTSASDLRAPKTQAVSASLDKSDDPNIAPHYIGDHTNRGYVGAKKARVQVMERKRQFKKRKNKIKVVNVTDIRACPISWNQFFILQASEQPQISPTEPVEITPSARRHTRRASAKSYPISLASLVDWLTW